MLKQTKIYLKSKNVMSLEIKIVKDNNVLELLNDKTFVSEWQELANQNEKVTVIQEPPFVTTWYRQYSNKYQPILILGFDKNSIVGLMPLAFSLNGQYLTHAGDYQAEYHGWLCKKDVDQEFPVQALIAIKHNFQLRKWQWRCVPPRSQVNWLSSNALKKEKIYVRIVEEDSPVLDLNDENKINKIKKNKALRNNINRYKKKNGFYIERIKSKEKARKIFDILSIQCDFRQMARHQIAPFGRDENKKPFYIERLNFPENNHFTILWSNNDPIAFHFGACDSDTVYLGLASYSPLEEKNSPGIIHIIKLIELLREEGYHYLDLTPGRDKYKEKYCNFHQKLYMPTIYFFKKDKIISDLKYLIRKSIKNLIISVGAQPDIVKDKLDNVLAMLKKIPKITPLKIIRKLNSILYERNVCVLYKFLIDDVSLNNFQSEESISINSYSDLLLYSNSNPLVKKTDLLSIALRRFASEEVLYTIVLNGLLAQYGWLTKGGNSHRFSEFNLELDFPEGSFILYDFYTEPNFSKLDLYKKTLEKMLIECRKNSVKEVYILVSENNIPSRSVIEKVGFKVYRKFQRTKTLWLVHKKDLIFAN
jgi:Acetyltransferase (GNAT) domain